jgi:hypothetical protein
VYTVYSSKRNLVFDYDAGKYDGVDTVGSIGIYFLFSVRDILGAGVPV